MPSWLQLQDLVLTTWGWSTPSSTREHWSRSRSGLCLIPSINNGTKDFVKFPEPRVPSSLQALFVKRGY